MISHARVCCLLISILLFSTSFCCTANADVIWFRAGKTAVPGQVVSESENEIVFRRFRDGKFLSAQTISRDDIKVLVVNIDPVRLGKLSPENPAGYRDYAEELATQLKDPVALDLARRLYLLAAANSEGDLRTEALRGLASLSRTDQERYQLEMFRHLTDPGSGNFEIVPIEADSMPTEEEKAMMLGLVTAIRQERFSTALKLLKPRVNRQAIDKWKTICTLEEIERIANVNRPNKAQLSKLLSIETTIRSEDSIAKLKNQEWGDQAMQPSSNAGRLPTIENVTRFDPSKSVFRNSRWIVPVD